jgi:hypothetical protein
MSVRLLRVEEPIPPEILPEGNLEELYEEQSDDASAGSDGDSELCLYRERTVVLLRRYLRMALEAGRLPSLLGREFFRSRFSGYRTHTFEDVVIFVHDVERSLEELNRFDQTLISTIVVQEHSQEDAARILGYARRTVVRCYPEAVDHVSEIFLRKHIMQRFPGSDSDLPKTCQEAKNDDFLASGSLQGKNNF